MKHDKSTLFLLSIYALLQSISAIEEPTCSNDDINSPHCSEKNNSRKKPIYRDTCRFYLAPSSIPNSGFGIYTTDAIPADTPITQLADAPSIILTDVDLHNDDKETNWNHHNYFWDGTGSGEFEAKIVEESVVTFGSLCNYHTYLKNVKPLTSEYDDSITSRGSGSPGMGAYSYQSGYLFHSNRLIEAGEEIFCDYGEEWLDGRDSLIGVAREEEYETAALLVKKVVDGLGADMDRRNSDSDSDSDSGGDALLKTVNSIVEHFQPRVSSVLPETKSQFELLQAILTSGAPSSSSKDAEDADEDEAAMKELETELAKGTLIPRTMSWIKTHGKCLDNLIPQTSTLHHAGRGAFAQRFIPKGSSVVPAPLLQMMDFRTLNIYEFEVNEDGDPERFEYENEHDPDDDDLGEIPRSYQLIMNYCMSHPGTSMFMCPQTNGILMNHCSSREPYAFEYGGDCDRYNNNPDTELRGANVKMVWPTDDWDPDTAQWLQLTVAEINDLVKKGKRGLSIDFIATRDIYPGDEVFIDYGEGWEEDWADHVKRFIPPPVNDYIPIVDLNSSMEKLRTPEESENQQYPSNAQLTCIYWVEDGTEAVDENSPLDNDHVDWENGDGSIYVEENELYKIYGYNWNCEVLDRNDSKDGTGETYTVELFTTAETTIWSETRKRRILHNYPRKSIKFFNRPYSSDQHIIGVFRSYIRIPDEIFPEQWKDIEIE